MDSFAEDSGPPSSDRLTTFAIVAAITAASMILMLVCMSPELIWDEADYVGNIANNWHFLWSHFDYMGASHTGFSAWGRHNHGPMAIFLAKLGQQIIPSSIGSPELRLRFFGTLVGSLAIGLLYWMLRRCFATSRAAAIAGCSLLLLSVIRLEETNIIGPHQLMLGCTLAIVCLGYLWRSRPSYQAALGLGSVIAFAYVSMEYVIPAVLCWLVAVTLAGRNWIAWDRSHFKISWSIPIMAVIAAVIALILWPPGVLQHAVVSDFRVYLHYSNFPTLVGDRIYELTPRTAAVYWLAHLDAPILAFSTAIILLAFWRAFRSHTLSAKHLYLGVFLAFFLLTALAAHMAGARNLLQFVGLLALATGAFFDEALGFDPRIIRLGCVALVVAAALNLFLVYRSYTPTFATAGYESFLKENKARLDEPNTKALIYGLPVLKFYEQEDHAPIAWDADEITWTTRADIPLPPDVKYVLIPSLVYNYMPPDQVLRREVADHWKAIWSFKVDHVWELRLYERPKN